MESFQENPKENTKGNLQPVSSEAKENDLSDSEDFIVIGQVQYDSENVATPTDESISERLQFEINDQLSDSYHSNYFGQCSSGQDKESIDDKDEHSKSDTILNSEDREVNPESDEIEIPMDIGDCEIRNILTTEACDTSDQIENQNLQEENQKNETDMDVKNEELTNNSNLDGTIIATEANETDVVSEIVSDVIEHLVIDEESSQKSDDTVIEANIEDEESVNTNMEKSKDSLYENLGPVNLNPDSEQANIDQLMENEHGTLDQQEDVDIDQENLQSVASFASFHSTAGELPHEVDPQNSNVDDKQNTDETSSQQHTPSQSQKISIEEMPTKTRQTLGNMASLGDLYCSIVENALGKCIQESETQRSCIKTREINETNTFALRNDGIQERMTALQLEEPLMLSRMANLPTLYRHGEFLDRRSDNKHTIRASFVYAHYKEQKSLDIFNEEIRYDLDFGRIFQHATDIVVGIKYGVIIPCTLSAEPINPEDNSELEDELKKYVKVIVDCLQGQQIDFDEFSISPDLQGKICLEICSSIKSLTFIESIQHAITYIQNTIDSAEECSAMPISLDLLSIETLFIYFSQDDNKNYKINYYEPQKFVGDLINAFSTLDMLKSRAATLEYYFKKYSDYISDDMLFSFQDKIYSFQKTEDSLRTNLHYSLTAIRRQEQQESLLLGCLNEVNNLIHSLATWLQTDRSAFFNKIQKIVELEQLALLYAGKNQAWERIVKSLEECVVFFFSLEKPEFEICRKEAVRLKNLGYCVLVVDQDDRKKNFPQNRLCYYLNGVAIKEDLCQEIRKEKMFCIVQQKTQNNRMTVACIRPQDAVHLSLGCPRSSIGQCSQEAKLWFCLDCRDVISYGFDEYFYCSCGRSSVYNFLYRCNDPNHGDEFVEYDRDVLSVLLSGIEPHKTLNVLILGETGVGKSTFINGFANYLSFSSIEQALRSDLTCLIPSRFLITKKVGKELREEEVRIGASSNENFRTGESSTQSPNGLIFEAKNCNKTIRLIDTPGIADVRGADQDDKNFEAILRFIENIDELHCILILLRPNSAKLNVTFKYCIGELLSHLHKSAAENIVFCFTNSRASNFDMGDTLPILRRYLNELKAERQVEIPVTTDTIYSFENEAFRYLCACKDGKELDQKYFKHAKESWTLAEEETLRLVHYICNLPAHPVRDSVSVNKARRVILTLAKPLAEITENIQDNLSAIERKKAEIEGLDGNEVDLLERLRTPSITIEAVELNFPRTVCTSPGCVETRSIGNSNVRQNIFITHCHVHCLLDGVLAEHVPNPKILDCVAIDYDTCRNCGCRWDVHMHITYDQELKETMVEDASVRRQIEYNQNNRVAIKTAIENCEQQIEKYELEQKKIMDISIKFGSFLKRYCMIPYNDAYEDYVKHLIRTEEHRAEHCRDKAKLGRMKELLKIYIENKRIIENTGNANAQVSINLDEINSAIEHLFNLELTGNKIRQFFETANTAQLHNYQRVEKRFNMPSVIIPDDEEEICQILHTQGTMFSLHAKVEYSKALFKKMSPWITHHFKPRKIVPSEHVIKSIMETKPEERLDKPTTSKEKEPAQAVHTITKEQNTKPNNQNKKTNKKRKNKHKPQIVRWNY